MIHASGSRSRVHAGPGPLISSIERASMDVVVASAVGAAIVAAVVFVAAIWVANTEDYVRHN